MKNSLEDALMLILGIYDHECKDEEAQMKKMYAELLIPIKEKELSQASLTRLT